MRGTPPHPPLNNKTPLVATDHLLCAAPSVSTALYVRCLVYALPCMWTTARFARCGGHARTSLNNKIPAVATDRLLCAAPSVSTALYVHRLVYALPCMWTTARFARCGGHPAPPVHNKTPVVATDRLLCVAPSVSTTLYVHRLVYVLPCMWTTSRFARCGGQPRTPLNNKTLVVATDCLLCAVPCVSTALYVQRLVYALPCMWTTARFARCGGHPRTPPK